MHISDLKVQDNKGKYQNSRIYIFPKGESIIQNLEDRKQRPYTVYRKELIPDVLETLKLPKDTKVRWSQYAGCSCPCSPGFIIEGSMNKNIFVTVDMKEPETV